MTSPAARRELISPRLISHGLTRHGLMLTCRRHVDLLRTSSAICRSF